MGSADTAFAPEAWRIMTADGRHFVLLTASPRAWLTADPAAAGQITDARRPRQERRAARIEDRVRQLRHAGDIASGGQLLTESMISLKLVVRLLKDRSCTERHGARFHRSGEQRVRVRTQVIRLRPALCTVPRSAGRWHPATRMTDGPDRLSAGLVNGSAGGPHVAPPRPRPDSPAGAEARGAGRAKGSPAGLLPRRSVIWAEA
ncbi:hypothetical protein [Streptomyces sp. NPDC001889]